MKVIHNISARKDLASHSEVTVHVSLLCWLGFQYLVTNTSDVFNYIQFLSWVRNALSNCLLYLELYLSVWLLFSALLLPFPCFWSTWPLITLLSIAGILPGLIFNYLGGDHKVSSTLLVPDAHIQLDYQHNLRFITYFVAVNSDASHHLNLSHYYWIWSLRVKTHLQFCGQITWWVIFTPNEFIAFVNCLVNRKSVSSAIKYSQIPGKKPSGRRSWWIV